MSLRIHEAPHHIEQGPKGTAEPDTDEMKAGDRHGLHGLAMSGPHLHP
jgi:hypothetical protein